VFCGGGSYDSEVSWSLYCMGNGFFTTGEINKHYAFAGGTMLHPHPFIYRRF
jgi:hypothetical protein